MLKMASLSLRGSDLRAFLDRYANYRQFAIANDLALDRDLEHAFARFSAAASQESAFNLGAPLDEGDDFWGRKTELDQLAISLRAGHNVVLVGDRRSGKSSLIRKLVARFDSPMTPVVVDLQAFPAQTELLLEGILREVVSALMTRGVLSSPDRWSRVSVSYASDFARALASLMAEVHTRAPDLRLILLLDEGDILANVGAVAEAALRQALESSKHTVVLLAITHKAADQLMARGPASRLLTMFTQVVIKALSEADLTNGVKRAVSREGLEIEAAALRTVYYWSGGIPWIAQFIGHHAAVEARQKSRTAITVEALTPIRAMVLEAASLLFRSMFDSLGAEEGRIVRRLLGRWRAGKQFKRFSPRESNLLVSLTARGVLVQDGAHYYVASTLFADWIREHI
jgi:hypothetical protein